MSNAKVACGWKCAIKICWLAARYQTGMTPELYWQLHLNFSLQMKLGGNVSFPRGMKRPEMELTTCLPFFSLTHPSKMFPFHTHLVIWKLRSVITWDGGALSSSRSLFFFFFAPPLFPPRPPPCVLPPQRGHEQMGAGDLSSHLGAVGSPLAEAESAARASSGSLPQWQDRLHFLVRLRQFAGRLMAALFNWEPDQVVDLDLLAKRL